MGWDAKVPANMDWKSNQPAQREHPSHQFLAMLTQGMSLIVCTPSAHHHLRDHQEQYEVQMHLDAVMADFQNLKQGLFAPAVFKDPPV